MQILTQNIWGNGFLDYAMFPGSVRIKAASWANIEPAEGLYFKRSFSFRTALEYIKAVGIQAVCRKAFSRLAEKNRNEKFFSIGIGRVIESNCKDFPVDTPVVFAAPVFPKACERPVLPRDLVKSCSEELFRKNFNTDNLLYFDSAPGIEAQPSLRGWQPFSGLNLDKADTISFLQKVEDFWKTVKTVSFKKFPFIESEIITTKRENHSNKTKINAALFGLGNYAKSQIIPNLSSKIHLKEIHEIDPTQIDGRYKKGCDISTSPYFNSCENCQLLFAAGYHHTHTPLAEEALKSGLYAAIEKPAATNFEDLKVLLDLDMLYPGKIFTCYHMRYNQLFKEARKDLEVRPGEPIHITTDVFEVPLPEKHWYRWPKSHSNIVSNGCHWIDHFLFMNDYSKPEKITLTRLSNGDSVSAVELENGACLCLHITNLGSPRIGVQDKIIMRAGSKTATVINDSSYIFEDETGIRRKISRNRMEAYKNMYSYITNAVSQGKSGDSREMLEYTNTVVLTLDSMYLKQQEQAQ